MNLLEGRKGIITGAGSGIGRAAAILFAQNGASLVVAGRRESALEETARLVREAGGTIHYHTCDVSKEKDVEELVAFAVDKLGGLNFAFNNSGVSQPPEAGGKLTHDFPEGVLENIMAINAFGLYYCMKYEVRELLKNGGGTICNTLSNSSVCGGAGCIGYFASKHAAHAMTMCAALDYADKNIRINGIGPGATDTDMMAGLKVSAPEMINAIIDSIPDKRMGTPEDMAKAALFLVSDLSTHINGQILLSDGGQTIAM